MVKKVVVSLQQLVARNFGVKHRLHIKYILTCGMVTTCMEYLVITIITVSSINICA